MCKKLIYLCLVFGFCLVSSAHAATIIWVSDNKTPTGGVPADQGWIDLLEANGHTVDLSFRNAEGRTLDAAKIDALNAADLIIISRDTDSGNYDDGQEPIQWNSITTPIIMQIGHIARNNRWLWLNTDATNDTTATLEVVESGHPVFSGVSIGANNQLDILTMGSSFANATDAGNGTLIAKRADNDQVWIAEWQAGQEFYPGSNQTAAGQRMYFVSGSDEGTDGRYNLTSDGEKMFLNAVRYMLGTLKRPKARNPEPPDGSLYTDIWVNLEWKAGDSAVSHDVYLGESFDDVNNGLGETFRGSQTDTFLFAGIFGYPYPDGLVPGTTYYWRIDEVNDADPNSPWKGDVWSFTVPSKKAYNSIPADGSQYVSPEIILSWTGGFGAKIHTVYIGEDFDAVSNATDGKLQASSSYTPASLELDKKYYWRVDEFDGTETHKGNVWSFTTQPDIQITDPNLIAWWKFDEGTGNRALDWSGHNNHGTLMGNPQWITGYDGDALDFDGNDDHVFSNDVSLPTRAFTIAFWFSSETGLDSSSGREDFIYWQSVSRPHMTFNRSGNGEIGLWPNIDGDFDGPETMTNSWSTGTWYHIAGTFDGTNFRIHVNGNTERSVSHPGENAATTGLFIGCTSSNATNFNGMIDDVRIYDYALSDAEIKEAMRGDPLVAWSPKPANNSTPNIKDASPLSWQPGNNAAQHDVYFGLDKNAVEDADASDTTGVYRIRQSATSYTPLEGVEWGGGPYYWRIDQVNTDGTINKGRIWSFTVADFILIDNFESYDAGDNQIWYAWHDGLGYGIPGADPYFAGNGTGAAVGDETTPSYTEETIVHSGSQSMPLAYDNNKQGFARYSEAELTLTNSRDWTEGDVAELSLWLRGYPASVGSFVESPVGTYTITASGADIWNAADQFHYAFKTLTGAGSIVAQVLSVDNTDPWAKAGVMIRETLGAGSKFAAVYITPGNGCSFQGRLDTDVAAVSDSAVRTTEQQAIVAPYWVKLERDFAGNFRASYSANGSNWIPMTWNPQNISMSTNVYVGLTLTSHNNNATCEARFSNVTITGNLSGQWTNQDVGIESNDAEPLYVAISNSAGAPAVVIHDDPAAANIDTWTEWIIPLSAFADQGISLTNVDRIAIGLGTQGNMTIPGGKGKMYFDDIRLYRSR
jgi:hypothetical protein